MLGCWLYLSLDIFYNNPSKSVPLSLHNLQFTNFSEIIATLLRTTVIITTPPNFPNFTTNKIDLNSL